MGQGPLTVDSRTSGAGIQDRAKNRVWEVTLPSISRIALIRPAEPLETGKFMIDF